MVIANFSANFTGNEMILIRLILEATFADDPEAD